MIFEVLTAVGALRFVAVLAFGLTAAAFFGAAAFLAGGAALVLVALFFGAPTFFSVFGALVVADFFCRNLVMNPSCVGS